MRRKGKFFIVILLTAVICLCGYQLWKMSDKYIHEAWVKNKIAKYSPPQESQESSEDNDTQEIRNLFIIDLQNEVNKNIIGWIIIPETKIDYPIAQAHDNDYYLRRDIFGNYALAGTVFTEDKTYTLEFFAYMVVRADDNIIYKPYATSEENGEFFEYVKKIARNYREPNKETNVATLSTCTYDGNARIVLLANIAN